MEIKIYQINMTRDEQGSVFQSMDYVKRCRDGHVDSRIYDEVYSGQVNASNLEDVFEIFNVDHPDGYRGRSLSVSDVVQVLPAEENSSIAPGFYFCDSAGYCSVDFDPELTQKSKYTMRVVMLQPGEMAEVKEIGTDLQSLQEAVGGLIEACYPFDDQACIVCNDEGKIMGMPLNRGLYSEVSEENGETEQELIDIIAGPCFICGLGEADFISLTNEQVKRYEKQFRYPERFFRFDGTIRSVKYTPKTELAKAARAKER